MTATLWDFSNCSLFSNLHNTSHISSSSTLHLYIYVSACDEDGEPRLIWSKNTLQIFNFFFLVLWTFNFLTDTHSSAPSFRTTELRNAPPRYDCRVLLVCAQLCWRPSFNSVLLRHLAGSLFQRGWHLFVPLRLMSRSPGKLKKQTSNMAMDPDKTSLCRFFSGVPAELHW